MCSCFRLGLPNYICWVKLVGFLAHLLSVGSFVAYECCNSVWVFQARIYQWITGIRVSEMIKGLSSFLLCCDLIKGLLMWSTKTQFSDGSVDSIGKLQEKLPFMRSELKDERKEKIESPFFYLVYDLIDGLSHVSWHMCNVFLVHLSFSEKFHEIYNFAFGWAKEKVTKLDLK